MLCLHFLDYFFKDNVKILLWTRTPLQVGHEIHQHTKTLGPKVHQDPGHTRSQDTLGPNTFYDPNTLGPKTHQDLRHNRTPETLGPETYQHRGILRARYGTLDSIGQHEFFTILTISENMNPQSLNLYTQCSFVELVKLLKNSLVWTWFLCNNCFQAIPCQSKELTICTYNDLIT